MDFTTGGEELPIWEFYHKYNGKLPKIVMINQGFYDDTGNDTFSREQVLRVHTSVRRQRVLIQSTVGRVRKTYSMSINFPETFSIKSPDGCMGPPRTLRNIVGDTELPVHVTLSRDSHVRSSKAPDMELVQTFEEISFLANDIDREGNLSPHIIKLPLCVVNVRLKLVTGLSGSPDRSWKSYNSRWSSECREYDYKEEQGLEDIAQYDESQITETVAISNLEPVYYTNLSVLLAANKDTLGKSTAKPVPPEDDVYEICDNVTSGTHRKGDTTSKKGFTLPRVFKSMQEELKNKFNPMKASQGKPTASPTPDVLHKNPREARIKPHTAPKPMRLVKQDTEQVKSKQNELKMGGNQQDNVGLTYPFKDYLSLKTPNTSGDLVKQRGVKHEGMGLDSSVKDYQSVKRPSFNASDDTVKQPVPVIYDPELDYDTAIESGRNYGAVENKADVFHRTDDVAEPEVIYANTACRAEVPPMPRASSDPGPHDTYENVAGQQNNSVAGRRGSRASTRGSVSRNLTPEEISELSMEEVSRYLRLLRLDKLVEEFQENQVDGKLLTMLTREDLKEFKLTNLEILKLQNFIREGHIPQ